jgi:hypothetical protein
MWLAVKPGEGYKQVSLLRTDAVKAVWIRCPALIALNAGDGSKTGTVHVKLSYNSSTSQWLLSGLESSSTALLGAVTRQIQETSLAHTTSDDTPSASSHGYQGGKWLSDDACA